MEERKINVMFNKSGSGSMTTRIALPKSWVDKMNVTSDEREVSLVFDGERIEVIKMKNNEFKTYKAAVEYLIKIADTEKQYKDKATIWDLYNLLDAVTSEDTEECLDSPDSYYIVNNDCIGFTNNNGHNVDWILTMVESENEV